MKKIGHTVLTRLALLVCICFILSPDATAQVHRVDNTQASYVSQCENHPTKTVTSLPAQRKTQEVKTFQLNAINSLLVRGGDSGGILVRGSDNKEIVVVACKSAWAQDEAEAQHLLNELVLVVDNQEVRADGPQKEENTMWRVNFIVLVPRKMEIQLRTNNGGINLYGLQGKISAYSKNGGIYFAGSGGDIDLKTQNGGIELNLQESVWNGKGLNAHSDNGGLIIRVPNAYQSGILAMTASNQLECKALLCSGSDRTWDAGHKILRIGSQTAINVSTEHAPLQILKTNPGE